MAFWHTKQFQQLKEKWYGKLDDSGFKDIERMPEPHINTAGYQDQEAIAIYYTRAQRLLYTEHLQDPRERATWFLHSEGYTNKEVAKAMALSQSTVSRVISKYRSVM